MAYILPVSAFLHPYTSPKPPRPIIRWTVQTNQNYRGNFCNTVGKFALPWKYLILRKSTIPWEYLQYRGNIFNAMGILCNIVRKYAIPWEFLQYCENIFNAVKISAMPWEYLQYFEKIWNVVGKLAILPKNKIVINLPMTYNKCKEDPYHFSG